MKRACIVFAMLLLAHTSSLQAQDESSGWSFNLFTLEGLTLSDTVTFDAEIAERNGLDLPAYFRIRIPRDPRIERRIIPNPSGGALVGIVFSRGEDQTGTDADLLELVQITGARVPMQPEHDGQELSRVQAAGLLARDIVLPRMIADKEGAELIDVSQFSVGEMRAAQVLATHLEPEIGPVLLRIVILPHPEQADGLMVVAKINLGLVPVEDNEMLTSTLSGRIISSWEYQ